MLGVNHQESKKSKKSKRIEKKNGYTLSVFPVSGLSGLIPIKAVETGKTVYYSLNIARKIRKINLWLNQLK